MFIWVGFAFILKNPIDIHGKFYTKNISDNKYVVSVSYLHTKYALFYIIFKEHSLSVHVAVILVKGVHCHPERMVNIVILILLFSEAP